MVVSKLHRSFTKRSILMVFCALHSICIDINDGIWKRPQSLRSLSYSSKSSDIQKSIRLQPSNLINFQLKKLLLNWCCNLSILWWTTVLTLTFPEAVDVISIQSEMTNWIRFVIFKIVALESPYTAFDARQKTFYLCQVNYNNKS